MAIESTPINTLQNLLDYDVRNFISAEVQLEKMMHLWISKSRSLKLKTVLQKYLAFIENNIKSFDIFLEEEVINSVVWHSRVMQAFMDEAEEKINYCNDAALKDACMLASVQKINHFKISGYGTAAAFANALGMKKVAVIIHDAEEKEKQIDDRLSQIAEQEINLRAKSHVFLHE